MAYSPYANIQHGPQPNVFITCGIQDPRVPYWEPLKFAAKLRAYKTNEYGGFLRPGTQLLMRVRDSGHFSSSQGSVANAETAEWYAFIISNLT